MPEQHATDVSLTTPDEAEANHGISTSDGVAQGGAPAAATTSDPRQPESETDLEPETVFYPLPTQGMGRFKCGYLCGWKFTSLLELDEHHNCCQYRRLFNTISEMLVWRAGMPDFSVAVDDANGVPNQVDDSGIGEKRKRQGAKAKERKKAKAKDKTKAKRRKITT